MINGISLCTSTFFTQIENESMVDFLGGWLLVLADGEQKERVWEEEKEREREGRGTSTHASYGTRSSIMCGTQTRNQRQWIDNCIWISFLFSSFLSLSFSPSYFSRTRSCSLAKSFYYYILDTTWFNKRRVRRVQSDEQITRTTAYTATHTHTTTLLLLLFLLLLIFAFAYF